MNTALIAIDGVLRKTMGGAPIPEGRRLYVSLANTGRVVLLGTGEQDEADWLGLNGMVQHDFVVTDTPVLAADRMRREGYGVDLVVLAAPAQAQRLIAAGLNTLLFTHAEYAHPEWRPDTPRGLQSWQEILVAVREDARAKAKDVRLKGDD